MGNRRTLANKNGPPGTSVRRSKQIFGMKRRTHLQTKKTPESGGFHKAGFTCRKIKRSTGNFVRTPFHTPATQGIVCYTFQVNCRMVMRLPLHKPFFVFIYDLSIFLTSTAFVSTEAKPRRGGAKMLFICTYLKPLCIRGF